MHATADTPDVKFLHGAGRRVIGSVSLFPVPNPDNFDMIPA
jgi:hypothetical protein